MYYSQESKEEKKINVSPAYHEKTMYSDEM